jgi:hypothetical protein
MRSNRHHAELHRRLEPQRLPISPHGCKVTNLEAARRAWVQIAPTTTAYPKSIVIM